MAPMPQTIWYRTVSFIEEANIAFTREIHLPCAEVETAGQNDDCLAQGGDVNVAPPPDW